MEPTTKDLAAGLLRAIQAENDGYHFYRMAARSTSDVKGREMFETLAKEEKEHARFLEAQYRAVLATGRPDPGARLGSGLDLSGPSPIFSDEIRSRLGEANYEMSALSIGIRLELASVDYYKEQAAAHSDPKVRAFFVELADWELGHYYALLRQEEALKDDYWAAAGFAPF